MKQKLYIGGDICKYLFSLFCVYLLDYSSLVGFFDVFITQYLFKHFRHILSPFRFRIHFFHPMLFVLPLKYASVSHLVGQIFGTYITIRHFELFSPSQVFLVLWLLLTSCSSIVHHCTG